MEQIRRKCGFINGIDMDAIGTNGGLSLGWVEGLIIILRIFSSSYIDVEVEEEAGEAKWRFTRFYGSLVEQN